MGNHGGFPDLSRPRDQYRIAGLHRFREQAIHKARYVHCHSFDDFRFEIEICQQRYDIISMSQKSMAILRLA
jgi:hypothetical protein